MKKASNLKYIFHITKNQIVVTCMFLINFASKLSVQVETIERFIESCDLKLSSLNPLAQVIIFG